MRAAEVLSNNSKLTDAEIIRRILNGEKELYELLLRRNNQKLYRMIRAYVRDDIEIEDIMQNTYLKAYEKLFQFKHSAKFSTWLIRIGINETLMRLREKGKMRTVESHSNDMPITQIIPIQKQHVSSPEELIIQKEAKLFIEKVIDLLDSKYKSVFIMKEVEGMSIGTIAECLDISQSNVKVRLHRAKAQLKDALFEQQLRQGVFEYGFSRCDNLVARVLSQI